MKKPNIPKGTRDFSPKEVRRRYYLIEVIKKHFERFGFSPIETPSFENLSVLMGKYGQEGERLIFKILNSGDFMKNPLRGFNDQKHIFSDYFNTKALLEKISEKALRYDLTIPLARYVVMHKQELHFPFKRYQIQPVWRADRPQRGRFREFYQCDADCVDNVGSLWQEVEFLKLYDAVFTELELPVNIQINHRELLSALVQRVKIEKKNWGTFIVALDKWDKVGSEKVYQEMLDKGICKKALDILRPIFEENGDFELQYQRLSRILIYSEKGNKALNELNFVWKKIKELGLQSVKIRLNIKLARGLDYYTGIIFEILPEGIGGNSIGGGGRYDELIEIFGLKGLSAVGMSFGLDRIYLVMETFGLFEKLKTETPSILFINFGEREALESMRKIQVLREKSIPSELYPRAISLGKQFQYANRKETRWVALIGKNEISKNTILIKDLISGDQSLYKDLDQLAKDYLELVK